MDEIPLQIASVEVDVRKVVDPEGDSNDMIVAAWAVLVSSAEEGRVRINISIPEVLQAVVNENASELSEIYLLPVIMAANLGATVESVEIADEGHKFCGKIRIRQLQGDSLELVTGFSNALIIARVSQRPLLMDRETFCRSRAAGSGSSPLVISYGNLPVC